MNNEKDLEMFDALDNHDADKFLFDKLLSHVGHHIECVWYGNE